MGQDKRMRVDLETPYNAAVVVSFSSSHRRPIVAVDTIFECEMRHYERIELRGD